jgi:hypothetical protein
VKNENDKEFKCYMPQPKLLKTTTTMPRHHAHSAHPVGPVWRLILQYLIEKNTDFGVVLEIWP